MQVKELEDILRISEPDINNFLDNIGRDNLLWDTAPNTKLGGQQISIARADIRLTHIPTNTIIESDCFRSQHLNRRLCVLKLMIKLVEDGTI